MFKREMKVNLKGFIVWSVIIISLYLVIYLVYPSVTGDTSAQKMDDLMKIFPEDMLKAFNMDLASIDTAYGWLKSEGFVFIYLIIGVYSGMLGASILLKEESEKTIEYLNSLPMTRTEMVLGKVWTAIIYITSMILCLGIFNFAAMSLSGDFDKKQLVLLSITPLFPALVIFAICMFISTFFHKTRSMLGISIGLAFAAYVLNVISGMSDSVEFLKYISPFTLADSRSVINDVKINPLMPVLTLLIMAVFVVLTIVRYRKKELV